MTGRGTPAARPRKSAPQARRTIRREEPVEAIVVVQESLVHRAETGTPAAQAAGRATSSLPATTSTPAASPVPTAAADDSSLVIYDAQASHASR